MNFEGHYSTRYNVEHLNNFLNESFYETKRPKEDVAIN